MLGGGGREHALGWKLARSPEVRELFFLPGNPGTATLGTNLPIAPTEIPKVLDSAIEHSVDLVVVGPEAPLFAGVSDALSASGFLVFGPSRKGAMLEEEKPFAKRFMVRHEIPTASFEIFNEASSALGYVESMNKPLVVKASGPALGKGVTVCRTQEEAIQAVTDAMINRTFSTAGDQVVIEECLEGEEASVLVLTDGNNYVTFPAAQDHKPIWDGDHGPNTGGMGAYAPAPLVSGNLSDIIEREIIRKILDGLRDEDIEYRGVLYLGLMITSSGPKVLEFNCRFGDPETQPLMLLMAEDLAPLLADTARGKLNKRKVLIRDGASLCVVTASEGYPGPYKKGKRINLDVEESEDFVCFHAGTRKEDAHLVTAGGRVLGVTAFASTLPEAKECAYKPLVEERINYEGMYFRKDIGDKGIRRLDESV